MALSTSDLQEIRNIVESALTAQTQEIIKPLQNEIQALRNDIKSINDFNGINRSKLIVTQ